MDTDSCLAQSTAHGLGNIGNERNTPGKLLWFLLTVITASIFIFHTRLLYLQLLEEHVLVSTHPDNKPFIQPDIVFCSERFFARDFIIHPPKEDYDYMLNVSKNIQRFNKLYMQSKNKSSSLIWDSLNSYELYKAFFHRKEELFLSIKCNFKVIPVEAMNIEMNFVYFACYRLNTSMCKLKSPLDSLIVKFFTYIHGVNITYSKLNVFIDNRPIDSFVFAEKEEIDEMEDGIHVYLVQPYEAINEGTSKMTASVNSHTTIKIKSTEYNRVSTKKSVCEKNPGHSRIYNLLANTLLRSVINITNDSLCIEIMFQRFIHKKFSCVLKRFPIPKDIPSNFTFCENVFESPKKYNYISHWRNPELMAKLTQICKNTVPCDSIIHTAVVNYNHWPRTSILRNIFKNEVTQKVKDQEAKNKSVPGLSEALQQFKKDPNKIDPWKRNFIKISISPAEFMSTLIEESSAYSFKNFFSDVGGIMGFYMGASLLTVCELLRLLHCTIATVINVKTVNEVEGHSLNENYA